MKLKKHQRECVLEIKKLFNENDDDYDKNKRGLIKMFCGSGKSFVIYHSIFKHGGSLSIIVVPSINLISQFNCDYFFNDKMIEYSNKKFNKDYELISICSKNELKEKEYSKKIKLTTEPDIITNFLQIDDDPFGDEDNKDKIVIITYQSLDTLFQILQENYINVDLICFDEAHHICADKTKKLLFQNEYTEKYVDKMLFFTATPVNKNGVCMYIPSNEFTIGDEYYEIINLDDPYSASTNIDEEQYNYYCEDNEDYTDCGKLLFEYMHKTGVNDNILNDFCVRVDLYTENTDKSVFEAISRAILETGNSRVLTFHSRSESQSDKGTNVNDFSNKSNLIEFKKVFNSVQQAEFPLLKNKYKNIYFEGITASTQNRRKILDKFDKMNDDEIFILSSCKTIGEGVDTKNANMVCFVDSKQSYIEIVQNIGRICRKNKYTKQKATVLIPAWVDKEKYKDCKGNPKERDKLIREDMNKGGNFNGILNVLSALRQEDPYMFELCLKYPEIYTFTELKENFKKEGIELNEKTYDIKEVFNLYDVKYNDNKTEKKNFKKLSKSLNVNIQITNQKILEEDLIIDNESEEWKYFVKTDDNKYMITNTTDTDTTTETKKNKIDRPNRNIKPVCHANSNVQVLWDFISDVNIEKGVFGGFIEANVKVDIEGLWIERLDKIKKYIDENNKLPSYRDKSIEVKSDSVWISNQQINYKKNEYIMKNKKICKLWETFINDPKYSKYFISNEEHWKQILEKVKKYVDENSKLPPSTDINPKINFIGSWTSVQTKNYKKNDRSMKNINIRKLWEEFINDPKYSKYFISNEEKWKLRLEKVKKYIDEYNKLPSYSDKDTDIKSEANWLDHQQQNYKNNKCIMKNPEVRKLWEAFINDTKYSIYFISNEEEWKHTLEKVKKYIDENNKRPSRCDKDTDIKSNGTWIHTQQKNYKKNKEIMSNPNIRKLWEAFVNDPKYSIYFISNEEEWIQKLERVKKYIDENNKRPSTGEKNPDVICDAVWIGTQQQNYKKNKNIMKNKKICKLWEEFINDSKYSKYFLSNEEEWKLKLESVKKYINKNNKRPPSTDKDSEIKSNGLWTITQKINYKKNKCIMSNPEIRKLWEEFIKQYQTYFPENHDILIEPTIHTSTISEPSKKSTNIVINENVKKESDDERRKRISSEYQELTKKMVIQKSETTFNMFKKQPKLWEQYHEARDFSFKGYDQDEVPVNKIIKYLETKKNHRLKILDLGCGRNYIKEYFKENKKFTITGYDYISYNGSKVADISNLEDEEDETIDVCIYSQSLMGNNWKGYLDEGKKILRYNGEIIISESSERYENIKNYLTELDMKIINEDYDKNKRWFYINVIKQ
jgi:superfamily II DNA or RNA helicase